MKNFLVCADIHTYLEHLERALLETGKEHLDGVVFAGDLEMDWQKLRDCIAPIPCLYSVAGNNDGFFSMKDHVPDERIFEICGHRILLTHGDRYHVPRVKQLVAAAKRNHCDVVIFGHTHKYYDETFEGIRLLNPGGLLGGPGRENSTYMTLTFYDDGTIVALKKEL